MALSGSFSKSIVSGHYKLKVDWTASQSISDNTSTITAKIYLVNDWSLGIVSRSGNTITINGTKHTFTSPAISSTGTHLLETVTQTISHNSDGSKSISMSCSFKMNATISGSYYGTMTASDTATLNTIARKSSLTASNGTLGTAQTLKVTKQSSGFTSTISYKCGSASGTICTKSSSTSISFTPPVSLASQNVTGTSVSITFTLTTYNGSTSLGSVTKTVSCGIPSSVKPTCNVTVRDLTGNDTLYGNSIQNLSQFEIVTTATTAYGSAISSYKITADGKTYNTSSVNTSLIKGSGNLTITATVTDRRGRTATASVNKTVIAYQKPNISSLAVKRCDADGVENEKGEYAKITFSGSVMALNNLNTANFTLNYKKSDETDYTTVNLTDLNNNYNVIDYSYIIQAASGSSYDIKVVVADAHFTFSKATNVSTAFTILHFAASGTAMGIGKVAEVDELLDVGLQTRFDGGILQPILKAGTNFNDLRTPNTYTGIATQSANYVNCPLTSGTFCLEVVSAGESGQIIQRCTLCAKKASKVWERHYYLNDWEAWHKIIDFNGTVLWSGAMYMNETQTVNLPELISTQAQGIELVFSTYIDGAAQNANFHHFFIHKNTVIAHNGVGRGFFFNTVGFGYVGTKYLYIYDNKIVGNADNDLSSTNHGITFNNKQWVLRYVIGV